MELKTGKSLKTAKEVRKEVYSQQDNTLIGIYNDAFSLHQFFYGWIDRIDDIEERFKSVEAGMRIYKEKDFLGARHRRLAMA